MSTTPRHRLQLEVQFSELRGLYTPQLLPRVDGSVLGLELETRPEAVGHALGMDPASSSIATAPRYRPNPAPTWGTSPRGWPPCGAAAAANPAAAPSACASPAKTPDTTPTRWSGTTGRCTSAPAPPSGHCGSTPRPTTPNSCGPPPTAGGKTPPPRGSGTGRSARRTPRHPRALARTHDLGPRLSTPRPRARGRVSARPHQPYAAGFPLPVRHRPQQAIPPARRPTHPHPTRRAARPVTLLHPVATIQRPNTHCR